MLRGTIAVSLAVATCAFNSTQEANDMYSNKFARQEVELLFEEWRREFGMEFESAEEHINRLNVFAANHVRIMEHNDSGASFKLAHNKFSHLTSEEFAAQYLGGYSASTSSAMKGTKHEFDLDVSTAPDAIDWAAKGAVSPVQDQGQCGSCWSFSTTGSVEGRYFIESGKLLNLSEQEMVDCDKNDNGCGGGLYDHAFGYVEEHGLPTEESYPYQSEEGVCRNDFHDRELPAGVLKGYVDVTPSGDENALKAAVAEGPVSVAISASNYAFQFYSSGVMFAPCSYGGSDTLDHAVLVVGYGHEPADWDNLHAAADYWKVKNSWGADWGEHGYLRMERNKDDMCGIAKAASYPKF